MIHRKDVILLGMMAFTLGLFTVLEGMLFNLFILDVLELTYFEIGIMVSISAAVGTTFFIIWGAVSDNTRSRFGRRLPFILLGGLSVSILIILFSFSNSLLLLIIIDGIFIAIEMNALRPAFQSLVTDLTEVHERGKISSYLRINNLMGAGFCLVLTFFFIMGIRSPKFEASIGVLTSESFFYICLISGVFLMIIPFLLFIFIKEPSVDTPVKKWHSEIINTFKLSEIRKEKDFFYFLLGNVLIYTGLFSFIPFFFPYFLRKFTLGEMILILPFLGLGLLLGFILFGYLSDKWGRKKLTIFGNFGAVICFFTMWVNEVLLGSLFMIWLILIFFVGLGGIGFAIITFAWVLDLVPSEKRAQFMGYNNIVTGYSQIPGALLGGYIAFYFGVPFVFLMVCIFFICSILLFLKVREILIDNMDKLGNSRTK